MNAFDQTKLAYERDAAGLADYWKGITSSRERHISRALALVDKPRPYVLELGCGPGRDAASILERTPHYIGVDYSKPLVELARKAAPAGRFIVEDMTTAQFPSGQDAVFAFASVIHLPPQQLADLLTKVWGCLNPNGIFYISAKEGHGTTTKTDRFGTRTYYLYDQESIEKLAGDKFETADVVLERAGKSTWVEILLRKR